MPLVFVFEDFNIVMGLAPIRHRPKNGVCIIGVNILVDTNDPLSLCLSQTRHRT